MGIPGFQGGNGEGNCIFRLQFLSVTHFMDNFKILLKREEKRTYTKRQNVQGKYNITTERTSYQAYNLLRIFHHDPHPILQSDPLMDLGMA